MSFIVFDLDDTLLNKNRTVSEYTLDVLEKLRKNGHFLVINTARSRPFQKDIFDLIRPDWSIINGGATILNSNADPIWQRAVPKETLEEILPRLLACTRALSVQIGDVSWSSEPYSRRPDYRKTDFSDFASADADKIVPACTDADALRAITEEYSLGLHSYFGGEYWRIGHKEATKGGAMLALIELCGADAKDSIAFGDDFGDVDMLLAAGHGVAMKNASEDIRELVPNTTDYTNDEDGVARYLARYFGI